MKERWIISPGIVQMAGKEPAYFASIMFGPTFDEYIYEDQMPDETKRYKVWDLMQKTGFSKQVVKNNLRKLVKHKLVSNVIDGYYFLTWDARLHILYVAERIVELSNDSFYEAARRYEMYTQIEEARKKNENRSGDQSGVLRSDSGSVGETVEKVEVGVEPNDSGVGEREEATEGRD